MNPVYFSSATDDWSTPKDFFADIVQEFGEFDLDVCASHTNAKAPFYFTPWTDGLSQTWFGHVWMNPPYGRTIGKWVEKACGYGLAGGLAVCLLPSRTDTRWWHGWVEPNRIAHPERVRFIRGRLKFGGAKHGAPFPSALVIFGNPNRESRPPGEAPGRQHGRAKETF